MWSSSFSRNLTIAGDAAKRYTLTGTGNREGASAGSAALLTATRLRGGRLQAAGVIEKSKEKNRTMKNIYMDFLRKQGNRP